MNPQLSESFLVEEYFRKDKTMKQIALENGYAVGTIFNWMKYYGIPVRHGFTKAGLENLRLRNSRRRGTKRPPFTEEHKARISAAKKGKYKRPTKYGGHSKLRRDGYISIYRPDHPCSNSEGYVMEHHLVMEEHIGRLIQSEEVVHHKNGNRRDNRIENLQLMTFKEHASLHMTERHRKRKEGVDLSTK